MYRKIKVLCSGVKEALRPRGLGFFLEKEFRNGQSCDCWWWATVAERAERSEGGLRQ
jgi:hypothetical protein